MNKKVLIGVAVFVAIMLLLAGLFALQDDDEDTSANESAIAQLSEELNTIDQPFTVTISTTAENDRNFTELTFEFIDKDTYRILSGSGDTQTEIIYDGIYQYSRVPGSSEFFRIEIDRDNLSTTVQGVLDIYEDASETELFKGGEYLGMQTCGETECEAYSYVDPESGQESTIRISGNRVIEVEAVVEDGVPVKTVYDYTTPVEFEIPTEFDETQAANDQ